MHAPPPRTSALAVASLVAGLLSWVGFVFIGAVVAVLCGHLARSEIRSAPPQTLAGDGMAVAGLVLGYLQLALIVAGIMLLMTVFGGLAVLFSLA